MLVIAIDLFHLMFLLEFCTILLSPMRATYYANSILLCLMSLTILDEQYIF